MSGLTLPPACAALALALAGIPAAAVAAPAYRVAGDAIPEPLAQPGDAERGRRIALDRNRGACVLCHALPEPGLRFSGTLGPALHGVGSRYDGGQLRLRVVDSTRINPAATMPSYYRSEGLNQVAAPYRGRTVLSAQEVEDVVAYLGTLK